MKSRLAQMSRMCAIVTVVPKVRIDHSGEMNIESETLDLTGQLLLAMPGISDARFEYSVILMCSHSSDGAMGLILNKPIPEVSFQNVLKQMKIAPLKAARPVPVQFGGPVETGRGFILHSDEYVADETTLHVAEGMAMTVTTQILEDLARGMGPAQSIMCMGYAGWGPLQLEGELQRNGWLTCAATQELVFDPNYETKWHDALKSMGIDPLMLSAEGGEA